jgi:hypothetical protein
MRKKVKLPVLQLFEKKLRKNLRILEYMLSAWVKKCWVCVIFFA